MNDKVNYPQLLKQLTLSEIDELRDNLIDCENKLENLAAAVEHFPDLFDKQISNKIKNITDVINKIEQISLRDNNELIKINNNLETIKTKRNISIELILSVILAAFVGTFAAIYVATQFI